MKVLILGGEIAGLAMARALDSIASVAMPITTQRILDNRSKPPEHHADHGCLVVMRTVPGAAPRRSAHRAARVPR